jgi:heat-inducible transcriptional repressor
MDERKAELLKTIIDFYIETAQPVSSSQVAAKHNLSSATIRAEMATLEQEGYLIQPHTSAGRIPTDLGYRFFVDHLTDTSALLPAQYQAVREFFKSANLALERLLKDTSHLLSRITESAGVVVGGLPESITIKAAQLVAISDNLVLLVVVFETGDIKRYELNVETCPDEPVIDRANAILRQTLVGKTLKKDFTFEKIEGSQAYSLVADAVETLKKTVDHDVFSNDQVFVDGASFVVNSFAKHQIAGILELLEQQYLVVSLINDVLERGQNISIGRENGDEPLSDCSLVLMPFDIDGRRAGSIGVLGPKHMNYQRAISAVNAIGQHLQKRLLSISHAQES